MYIARYSLSTRSRCLKSVSQSQGPIGRGIKRDFTSQKVRPICFSHKVRKTAEEPAGSSFMHETGIQPVSDTTM